jgi:hypothetical protein
VGGREPGRCDHHRQAVDERDDRLEPRAPRADDDRRAQRCHRHLAGLEDLGGLEPAAQVGRQIGPVVAQSAQVDDLRHLGPRRLAGDRGCPLAVELREVRRAERVDEVIHDVRSLERAPDGLAVGDVGGHRPHPFVLRLVRTPRDRDHVVVLGEDREQGPPDHACRAQDDRSHAFASASSRAK